MIIFFQSVFIYGKTAYEIGWWSFSISSKSATFAFVIYTKSTDCWNFQEN